MPGIDWNIAEQLKVLDSLSFGDELSSLPSTRADDTQFYLGNGFFESGDAEYWYNMIRLKKPKNIIEIGSGNSTLLAAMAIKRNKYEDPNYRCEHICIEPYRAPWLEKIGVSVIRQIVEDVDIRIFEQLGSNDFLFIDSSHIIRAQGDVVFEYLELLPSLRSGVIVHVHDIFSPKDYPAEWVQNQVLLWNEQYLLEAFLTSNADWQVIGALNYLRHNYFQRLKAQCPHLTADREPGSFYLQKTALKR